MGLTFLDPKKILEGPIQYWRDQKKTLKRLFFKKKKNTTDWVE